MWPICRDINLRAWQETSASSILEILDVVRNAANRSIIATWVFMFLETATVIWILTGPPSR